MKKILQKCTREDLQYISDTLSSYFSFTKDKKRRQLLKEFQEDGDNTELIELIDRQIRYYGTSDFAYIQRKLLRGRPEITTQRLIRSVFQHLKINDELLKIKIGASTEMMLEKLVSAMVEKEIIAKNPQELVNIFKEDGLVDEKKAEKMIADIKKVGPLGAASVLTKLLGSEALVSIASKAIVTVVAPFISQHAAATLATALLSKVTFQIIAPALWAVTFAKLSFTLQGPAYRKTVPICLYLGIVALRDGLQKDPEHALHLMDENPSINTPPLRNWCRFIKNPPRKNILGGFFII